jgi:polyisoprenoid-binding protein YceI
MSSPGTTFSSLDPAVTGTYQLDSVHSRVGFVVRHAMVTKVRGNFTAFDGSLVLNAEEPANPLRT